MSKKRSPTPTKSKSKEADVRRVKFADPLQATCAQLIDMAKARAKRKRVPFSLTQVDVPLLTTARMCPVTGLPFVLGTVRADNRPHPMSPSLDRIEASKGYVRGNVRLTSWWANSARNSLTDAQFAVFVEAAFRTRQSAALQ